jgi:hypothetical protein
MLLALGLIIAASGAITFYLLNKKKEQQPIPPDTFASKIYDYKGVRPHDFIKNRVMFYPYNYVNG